MKDFVIDIQGMEQSSSADNLQKALELIPGVQEAQVDFDAHRARLTYDESEVEPNHLVEVIEKAGYKAHRHSS